MREVSRVLTLSGVIMAMLMIGSVTVQAEDYNLLGFEGIGTLGHVGYTSGPPPVVADYVTTHCRYIDVQNTPVGHFFLRYPLDLPDGATITSIKFYIGDFNPSGSMWFYLRSRPWNSRDAGTTETFTLSPTAAPGDTQIELNSVNVTVNNQTTEYWIDVSPQNSSSPGQLCVYGIHVTYN